MHFKWKQVRKRSIFDHFSHFSAISPILSLYPPVFVKILPYFWNLDDFLAQKVHFCDFSAQMALRDLKMR